MKNTFLLIVLIFLNSNCTVFKNDDLASSKEREKIEKCRENWNYKTNDTPIEITIIKFQKKRYFTLNNFPNFFIGTTLNRDTIGIIEYDTDRIFKKGEIVKFQPESKRNQFNGQGSLRDYPIFTVYKTVKENDLLCSIKTVFYGKIDENFENKN